MLALLLSLFTLLNSAGLTKAQVGTYCTAQHGCCDSSGLTKDFYALSVIPWMYDICEIDFSLHYFNSPDVARVCLQIGTDACYHQRLTINGTVPLLTFAVTPMNNEYIIKTSDGSCDTMNGVCRIGTGTIRIYQPDPSCINNGPSIVWYNAAGLVSTCLVPQPGGTGYYQQVLGGMVVNADKYSYCPPSKSAQ